MSQQLYFINKYFSMFGFDIKKTLTAIRGIPTFWRDYKNFKFQRSKSNEIFLRGNFVPCLGDRYGESGTASGHYFYQDWYVARRIFLNNPQIHLDVGSRIDGFVTHVASFRSIKVIDIRPLSIKIPNIEFVQADLLGDMHEGLVGICDSLSCLHALEHFGLGRYGDPVDYDGYLVGLKNLSRLLRTNGKFYLSVPIGPQRVEFNAHRVFSIRYILDLLKSNYIIDGFSYIDFDNETGLLFEDVELTTEGVDKNFGCNYGCGIFEATKL